jgi:hypothetical protein
MRSEGQKVKVFNSPDRNKRQSKYVENQEREASVFEPAFSKVAAKHTRYDDNSRKHQAC